MSNEQLANNHTITAASSLTLLMQRLIFWRYY